MNAQKITVNNRQPQKLDSDRLRLSTDQLIQPQPSFQGCLLFLIIFPAKLALMITQQ